MRAVVQRVTDGSVTIEDRVRGKIGKGFVVLLGIHTDDTPEMVDFFADKIVNLRVFEDEAGKMNRSLLDAGGAILLVSQFTLYADCSHGRRPSFIEAARPEKAIPLYERMIERLRGYSIPVETGEFGADMQVRILNDGPVTIILDSNDIYRKKVP
ncbi:MAG: D-tyrosyl-tRNA(Tyr) deacylase [Clostridia bacterium]|nr:D-tyrosyl-tRNA(Tyr) deacylase [Clostridia bacterium]